MTTHFITFKLTGENFLLKQTTTSYRKRITKTKGRARQLLDVDTNGKSPSGSLHLSTILWDLVVEL
jgi:hypothetical protein